MSDMPTGVNPSSTANPTYPNVGVKTPNSMRGGKKVKIRKPRMQGGNGANSSGAFSSGGTSISAMYKAERIVEGDYVMGLTTEGAIVGLVEHVMTEGGVYGVAGTEYAIQSTPEIQQWLLEFMSMRKMKTTGVQQRIQLEC